MKFSPRNAAELGNLLSRLADFYDAKTKRHFEREYDIGVHETASQSEWCRFVGENLGWSHEIDDEHLPTLIKELESLVERGQDFFEDEEFAEVSDGQLELHIRLLKFYELMLSMCMNGSQAIEDPPETALEEVAFPEWPPIIIDAASAYKKDSLAEVFRAVSSVLGELTIPQQSGATPTKNYSSSALACISQDILEFVVGFHEDYADCLVSDDWPIADYHLERARLAGKLVACSEDEDTLAGFNFEELTAMYGCTLNPDDELSIFEACKKEVVFE